MYKDFQIKIDVERKFDRRKGETVNVYRWRICHMGYTLESGREDFESESACERSAERAIDNTYSRYGQ